MISQPDVVLIALHLAGRALNSAQIRRYFTPDRRPDDISAITSTLVQRGHITRPKAGLYRITQHGSAIARREITFLKELVK